MRWLLDYETAVAEGDDADLNGSGLVLDKGACGLFGGRYSTGLEIIGSHAVGDVEGEDDGALDTWQFDDHLGPGQAKKEEGQGDQEEQGRNVAAFAGRALRAVLQHAHGA